MGFLAFLRRKRRSSKRRVDDDKQEVQLPQPDQLIDSSKSDEDDFTVISHPITINTTAVIRRFS
ncbi:hypothetical protein FRX31_009114 [Thalictrum thalictroides]|uniref:Uncharacterized protein n=1 Tax=Thalictrum thalictroides TaxID=46969 RepID=A0A7J6WV64_THATH|nr:hypothetical protein FRX31_009114 [Thalictrum thalictroides]